MAFTNNTAFLPRIWNNRNDDTQNLAGYFGTVNQTTQAFTKTDCSAGFACNIAGVTADKQLEFVAATAAGGDLYFCNPSDVERVRSQDGELFTAGGRMWGLGLPAGVLGTFTKAVVGEVYAFGAGNFAMLPDQDNPYVELGNGGLLSAVDELPDSGYYFEVWKPLGTDSWTVGNTGGKTRINLVCRHV